MKRPSDFQKLQPLPPKGNRGFALVITLSLMILPTLLAVGLLSLSAVQLRASGQGQAMAVARANARLSLMIALGDLRRAMGPDGRVSVPAEQTLPAATAARSPHAQWTGGYEAWNADQGLIRRPEPKFIEWLTSAAARGKQQEREFAASSSAAEIPMVGTGTLGVKAGPGVGKVTSPAVSVRTAQQRGTLTWWVSDESMKANLVRRRHAAARDPSGGIVDPCQSLPHPRVEQPRAQPAADERGGEFVIRLPPPRAGGSVGCLHQAGFRRRAVCVFLRFQTGSGGGREIPHAAADGRAGENLES